MLLYTFRMYTKCSSRVGIFPNTYNYINNQILCNWINDMSDKQRHRATSSITAAVELDDTVDERTIHFNFLLHDIRISDRKNN